jgi:mono/diheme cytochrome c family protein
MRSKLLRIRLLLFVLVSLSALRLAAADVAAGKTIFINNCAQCHNKNMKDRLTGPPLAKAVENWGGDMKRLYSWVRNSVATKNAGDPRAVAITAEYGGAVMSTFPSLKDGDIDNIFAYVALAANPPNKGPTGGGDGVVVEEKDSNTLLYGVAFVLLALLALVLGRIVNNLNRTAAEKEGSVVPEKTWVDALTSKAVMGFLTFGLIVLGGYTTVNNAISLGRQQNYAPDQPIKFSHATHAGLNKIDCQYCHDGARRSKQSVIPATNTCMNCHKAIKVGSQYKTAELTKVFVSAGFDPTGGAAGTGDYIPNYDNLSQDEVAAIFKKWIGARYREERKLESETSDEKLFVNEQWNDIVSSLTIKGYKDKVQGPIEWKRIHNLPDHVYFNHAQHVTVGQVACQKCHGTVEKMEVLKQSAPLSMGWCVNCHRETEVKFKDNDFYKSYARYHEEIKKGTREKVTVQDIGGLECQKCHY